MAKNKKLSNTKLRDMLKSAKVRGSISKMNRAALLKAAKEHNLDTSSNSVTGGAAPEIEPKGDAALQPSNGDGSSVSLTSGAAPAVPPKGDGGISLAPVKTATAKPLQLTGGGTKHKVMGFREFVKKHSKEYKGNMKELAKAWREQKGSGKEEQEGCGDDEQKGCGDDEQKGCGDAHDEFMKATHKYCDQDGKGVAESFGKEPGGSTLAESQMNGEGRGDGDAKAHEDKQMDNMEGAGQMDDYRGGTKRKVDEADISAALDDYTAKRRASSEAFDARDAASLNLEQAQQEHDQNVRAHNDFLAGDLRPAPPGAPELNPEAAAQREDYLRVAMQGSAGAVSLNRTAYDTAFDNYVAAIDTLADAEIKLEELTAAQAAQDAAEDAEDRDPDESGQMNAMGRHALSYLEYTSSDDEDLLTHPFPHMASNPMAADYQETGYDRSEIIDLTGKGRDISKYLEGGSFWKDAATATGAAMTSAAPALAAMPIPGARAAALGALGVGALASGATSIMKD
tara:strand:+ start:6484 stop:8016 length:1533 start_codon:yes stop_codon:yes gene_type:complete